MTGIAPRALYLVMMRLNRGTDIAKVAVPNAINTVSSFPREEIPAPRMITFLKASMA